MDADDVKTLKLILKRLDELAVVYDTEHYSKGVRGINNSIRAAVRELIDNNEGKDGE